MRIGIDLGGTKTEILCLGAENREIFRHRTPTIRGNYSKTIESIRDLVLETETKIGETGSIGIGIPGSISKKTGLVKNANSTWLIGHPFQADLSDALGREVRMTNDANCLALSEAIDGSAKEYETVFGVILGTGTGGGLVVQKQVLNGLNGTAGEWGHITMPWQEAADPKGMTCYCHHENCIETFLCGSALAKIYNDVHGLEIEARDIPAQNEDKTEPVYQIYENRLARALSLVINLYDPDAIVMGGGVSNIDRWYETVPKLWQKWVFGNECDTPLLKAKHGDSSGVRGAAWLWPEKTHTD